MCPSDTPFLKTSSDMADEPYASVPPSMGALMETVTHHQGYCIVAVASDVLRDVSTYLITKHDWCGQDAPVQGVCPGAFDSQGEALASAVRAATRYIGTRSRRSSIRSTSAGGLIADGTRKMSPP